MVLNLCELYSFCEGIKHHQQFDERCDMLNFNLIFLLIKKYTSSILLFDWTIIHLINIMLLKEDFFKFILFHKDELNFDV